MSSTNDSTEIRQWYDEYMAAEGRQLTQTNSLVVAVQDDELDEYLEDIDGRLEEAAKDGDDDILTDAHEQFTGGCDGILKMLLISHCPRLRAVKFVTQQNHDKSTLGWLRKIIQGSINYDDRWPPGISNIQEIAVGVESDTRLTDTQWGIQKICL